MVERLYPRIAIEMNDGRAHLLDIHEPLDKFIEELEIKRFLVIDMIKNPLIDGIYNEIRYLILNIENIVRIVEFNDN